MALGSLPEAPWLLAWLGEWTATPTAALPDMPTDMRIGAGWALTLIQNDDGVYAWRNAAGELRLSTHSCRLAGHRSRGCRATSTWPLEGRMDCLPTELKAATAASIVHPADGRAGRATPESAEYKRRAGSH